VSRASSAESVTCENRVTRATIVEVESPIEHRDVTTIMRLLADIQMDVRGIRNVLEDEDGEEEAPEDDA
jgi:hypothetical protein